MEVKIFEEFTDDQTDIETAINQWFKANPDISIHTIKQSESACSDGHDDMIKNLTVSIFFERKA